MFWFSNCPMTDRREFYEARAAVRQFAEPNTRLVMNFFNNLWRPVLALAEKIGAKAPTPQQNWLSSGDMKNLLHLADWELVKMETRILWPLRTPLVAPLANRWLAPLLRPLCLTVFLVARPRPRQPHDRQYRCTVVIPARNDAGNIAAAAQRTPENSVRT